jgi:Flp pilus assembly protein TadG
MKAFKPMNCTGSVLVLTTISLVLLLGVVGLAVDTGGAYGVKAKLNAAVDAAALAAAKAVAEGEGAARAAARKYFAANIPEGYLRSDPELTGVSISYNAAGDATIDVSATAPMPTTFLRVIGKDQYDVGVHAQTIRRAVDLALVVDNSTSLRQGALGDVTQDVIDRSKDFVHKFHENYDRLALIKYAFGAEVPVPFGTDRGFDKDLVMDEIDAFEFGSISSPQLTNSSEGFWNARDQLDNAANPSSLQVIVFFTDGAPNTFSSRFEFKNDDPHEGSIRTADDTSPPLPFGWFPAGLWEPDKVYEESGLPWNWPWVPGLPSRWPYYGTGIARELVGLPAYYNPHDPGENEFLVINPGHPRRPVTDYSPVNPNSLWRKVNRISRNLVEDMAEAARKEGKYVYTLGLGSSVADPTGPDSERGEDLLMRMANDPRADTYEPDPEEETQGIYCYAVDEDALGPCYEKILEAIIRLTI